MKLRFLKMLSSILSRWWSEIVCALMISYISYITINGSFIEQTEKIEFCNKAIETYQVSFSKFINAENFNKITLGQETQINLQILLAKGCCETNYNSTCPKMIQE